MTSFLACLFVLPHWGFGVTRVFLTSVLVFVGVQAGIELVIRKTHRRATTGLEFDREHFRRNFSVRRSLEKLVGLYLTLGVLALVYVLIPQYSGTYYQPFWHLVKLAAPFVVALSVPYFLIVDALMVEPRDGYWYTARLAAFRWHDVDWKVLREYALGWVIKGFFLPIMTPALFRAVRGAVNAPPAESFVALVYDVSRLALCVDLSFVVIGYIFTLRILDSHIRSANPYVWGWIACVVLYKPFWAVVGPLFFNYNDGVEWYGWFADSTWLLCLWGFFIMLAKIGWAWSNIMFGFRFSNLTNRGIITNGPFRLSKHPSYLCKNVSWWLLSVPFLSQAGFTTALTHCIALLGVNVLYLLRALSEELHLSEEPAYVEYALWMNEHGLLRGLARFMPWLRYRPPAAYEFSRLT